MGQNLTGQTIASTYEDLVQISGSILTNGLGTDITSVDITASNAVSSSYAVTASFALNAGGADTGSLLVTASISDATITFTKGDASTFDITVNNVQNASTASIADTASYSQTSEVIGLGGAGIDSYITMVDSNGLDGVYQFRQTTPGVGALTYNDAAGAETLKTKFFQGDLIGNADTATTASYALTASSLEGGVSLQTVLDTGNSAIQNLILTGSAEITGSLRVVGPQTGLLTNRENIEIFATQSANALVPTILIGAQDPAHNGLNTGIGFNNIVLGTGEFITDLKGIVSGSGNSNIVAGGWGGLVGRGSFNTIIGGGKNTIASGSTLTNASAATYNFMGGGANNTIGERTTHSNIIGGASNAIVASGSNGSVYSTILGGQTNWISGSDYSGILASRNSDINLGNNVAIVGGNNLTATYATATTAYSAMLGGNGNTLSHSRTVVIGGQNLASTKDDEVLVPNLTAYGDAIISGSLTITGSAYGNVNALSISSNTASLDLSTGNFFTLQLVSGSDTHINPSNIQPGQTINIRVNTTGSGTVSFPSSVLQVSGSAYVPTTTTGVDVVTLISFDNSSLYLANVKNLV